MKADSLISMRTAVSQKSLSLGQMSLSNVLQTLSSADFNTAGVDPLAIEKRIATLVTNEVEQGEKLSEVETALLGQVIDMLKQQVQPSIISTHENEQSNLNRRIADIQTCNTGLQSAEDTTITHSHDLSNRQKVEYDNQKAALATANMQKSQEFGALTTWLEGTMSGSKPGPQGFETCQFPPSFANTKQWILANSKFFNDSNPIYASKDALCKSGTANQTAETIKMAAENHIYHAYVCDHCEDIAFATDDYESCYQSNKQAYGTTVSEVTHAVAVRKVEWEAIEFAVGYLQVLNDDNKTQQVQKLADVKSLVVDTSHLDITFGDIPEQSTPKYQKCAESIIEESQCTLPTLPTTAPTTSAPTEALTAAAATSSGASAADCSTPVEGTDFGGSKVISTSERCKLLSGLKAYIPSFQGTWNFCFRKSEPQEGDYSANGVDGNPFQFYTPAKHPNCNGNPMVVLINFSTGKKVMSIMTKRWGMGICSGVIKSECTALYSISNNFMHKQKASMKGNSKEGSIYCNHQQGIAYGWYDHDFYIWGNFNQGHCKIGINFECRVGSDGAVLSAAQRDTTSISRSSKCSQDLCGVNDNIVENQVQEVEYWVASADFGDTSCDKSATDFGFTPAR